MPPPNLDAIDRRILRELMQDGRLTNVALAQRAGITPPPCLRRVRALEEAGYITGYHAAVDDLFGIEVDKEQTRSNWCKRPLTDRQLHYAAMDVVLLPAIVGELQPRLEQAGRWAWLQEDIARMQRTAQEPVRPEHAWRRIRGAARLDDTELRVLRALAAWREETAMERDLARGFVIPDIALLQLARARPVR